MFNKLVDFFIKKKVETATGTISQTSKTKIFITLEGLARLVEFVSPYFYHQITIPEHFHGLLYSLAGLSYAERTILPAPAK